MGLFGTRTCKNCGKTISRLEKRSLAGRDLCSDCAKKLSLSQTAPQSVGKPSAPGTVTCPYCGAQGTPDKNGTCRNCGASLIGLF